MRHARFSLAVMLCFLVSLSSCDRATVVVVNIRGLPADAETLHILAALERQLARERLSYSIVGHTEVSLALRLPAAAQGPFIVAAAVSDAAGCLLAVGETSLNVASPDQSLLVEPVLANVRGKDRLCDPSRPTLLAVTPPSVSTTGRDSAGQLRPLRLSGWGFIPGATVGLGWDEEPRPATFLSPLALDVEPSLIRSAPGPVGVSIQNPDSAISVRDDLLRLYAAPIAFFATDLWSNLGVAGRLTQLAVQDMNADSRPDVVGLMSGIPVVFLNLGQFSFRQVAADGAVGLVSSFQLGDVNGDGRSDVVVKGAAGLQWLLNRGDGSLVASASPVPVGSFNVYCVDDINRDGAADVVVGDTSLRVHLNQGGMAFVAAPSQVLPVAATQMRPADLNVDGYPELIVLAADGSLTVYSNRAGVLVSLPGNQSSYPPTCSGGIASLVNVVDLDGDGQLDLLPSRSQSWLARRGDTFISARYIKDLTVCPGLMNAADLNGDGLPELVGSDVMQGLRAYLQVRGTGITQSMAAPIAFDNSGYETLLADLDQDGKIDVLTCGNVYRNTSP